MVPIAYGRTVALDGASKNAGGIDPRLKPAAQEFEASLIQELLKPMEKDPLFSSSGSSDGMGLMSGDAGMSTWSSLGAQSLAKAISDAGGLGIATKIIAEVEAQAKETKDAKPVTAGAGTGAGSQAGSADKKLLHGDKDLQSWSAVRRLP